MGKGIWTLSKAVAYDEPDEHGRHDWREKVERWEFANFGKARGAFRSLLRECAKAQDEVFDGDGSIYRLQGHFDKICRWREKNGHYDGGRWIGNRIRSVPDYSYMAGDFEAAAAIPSALRKWLLDPGRFSANPLPEFKWTDWTFGMISTPGALAMGVLDEADRIEFYDAQLYTNAFDMSKPSGDYEFSVRTFFDCYDTGGGLCVRLAPGRTDGLSRFPWPEDEDVEWPWPEGPAPCLAGRINGNERVFAVIPPKFGKGLSADQRLREYERFVEGIIAHAEISGFDVDRRIWLPEGKGDRGTSVIDCYRTGDAEVWSRLTVQVNSDFHSRYGEGSSIRVGDRHFKSYQQALDDVKRIVDDHVERMRDKGCQGEL